MWHELYWSFNRSPAADQRQCEAMTAKSRRSQKLYIMIALRLYDFQPQFRGKTKTRRSYESENPPVASALHHDSTPVVRLIHDSLAVRIHTCHTKHYQACHEPWDVSPVLAESLLDHTEAWFPDHDAWITWKSPRTWNGSEITGMVVIFTEDDWTRSVHELLGDHVPECFEDMPPAFQGMDVASTNCCTARDLSVPSTNPIPSHALLPCFHAIKSRNRWLAEDTLRIIPIDVGGIRDPFEVDIFLVYHVNHIHRHYLLYCLMRSKLGPVLRDGYPKEEHNLWRSKSTRRWMWKVFGIICDGSLPAFVPTYQSYPWPCSSALFPWHQSKEPMVIGRYSRNHTNRSWMLEGSRSPLRLAWSYFSTTTIFRAMSSCSHLMRSNWRLGHRNASRHVAEMY